MSDTPELVGQLSAPLLQSSIALETRLALSPEAARSSLSSGAGCDVLLFDARGALEPDWLRSLPDPLQPHLRVALVRSDVPALPSSAGTDVCVSDLPALVSLLRGFALGRRTASEVGLPQRLVPDPLDAGLSQDALVVAGIRVAWDTTRGLCTFRGLPVAMMWVDTTLAGLMAGVAAMVGPERFALALQAEGRKSVESDWVLISRHESFEKGFEALRGTAAVAGWGDWQLVLVDRATRECVFRAYDNWEGLYQRALGVCWGSGMLAGKFAGICSKLFETNCWATQTAFVARGDSYDEFVVGPSTRLLEDELARLLDSDQATRADMAVALQKLRDGERVLRHEVAERRQAEEATRASEARLAGIVGAAMEAIVLVDEAQRILVFNPAAEAIFRCPAPEALGQSIERFIPIRHLEAHRRGFEEFARTGVSRFGAGEPRPIAGLRADGEEFPAEAYIARVRVGDRIDLAVVLRDVSERDRAEADRRSLELQLQHAQRLEAVGTLAGGIAHDFNNLLSAIIGNLDLADLALPADHPVNADLLEVRRASVRATELVRRLLTFSRLRPAPAPQQLSLRDTTNEATRLLRSLLPAGVQLRTTLTEDVLNVVADPTQMHQVVMNLCTNAWHALNNGRGSIHVRLDAVDCDADSKRRHRDLREGRYARITVSDDGCGMDEESQRRIFEPFFTTKEPGRGTGLGLSVVHGILQECGGAIEVESEVGRGSTFRVYLPALGGAVTEPGRATVLDEIPPGEGQCVLVIDDEESIVEAVTRMLLVAGFAPTGCSRAREAMQLLRDDPRRWSLVLTDLNMPLLSGIDIAAEAQRLRPELPVILSSGHLTEEAIDAATAFGVRQILPKPYGMQELVAIVAKMIQNGRPTAT